MESYSFALRDRILAVPIVLAALFCVLSASQSAVVIPGAALGMIFISVPTSLWLLSYFVRRARPVHKLSLVFGIVALFIHPEVTSGYAKGWSEGPDFFVSKGIEKEILPESVLKAKIARASDPAERSHWTNRFIQHLYIHDLWQRQRNRAAYILYRPSVALLVLAVCIGCLSRAGDTVIIEIINPHGREQDGKS